MTRRIWGRFSVCSILICILTLSMILPACANKRADARLYLKLKNLSEQRHIVGIFMPEKAWREKNHEISDDDLSE